MEDGYKRLGCVSCEAPIDETAGRRGRRRIRCTGCSPVQLSAPREPACRAAICANQDCGMAFTATEARVRYCSALCRSKVGNRRTQERARDRSSRPCEVCQVSFTPAYGDQRKTICSPACKAKKHSQRTAGTTHRRRAKRFGGRFTPVDRLKVLERDAWTCYLCGCDTPKELSGKRQPTSPEIDHVVPLSKGGNHTMANLRCACRACNLAKGDKTLDEFLASLPA